MLTGWRIVSFGHVMAMLHEPLDFCALLSGESNNAVKHLHFYICAKAEYNV